MSVSLWIIVGVALVVVIAIVVVLVAGRQE